MIITKTIIVVDSDAGGIGNRIQYQAYLFSWAYLHHSRIVFIGEKKSYKGLKCSCDEIDQIVKCYPYYNRGIVRRLRKLLLDISQRRWCPRTIVNLSLHKKASAKLAKNYITLLVGWYLYDTASLTKCSKVIRKYFAPETDMVERLKKRYGIREDLFYVAVHIRRGDYEQWKDGRYYLNDNTYRKYMDQYYRFHDNAYKQPLCFLLFSNEEINYKEYQSTLYPSVICNGSAIEDFCTMISICDAIIGPPSTFSGMASFLGNIPKYVIDKSATDLQINEKSVVHIDIDDYGNSISFEEKRDINI